VTLLLREPERLETWGAEDMPEGFFWWGVAHNILQVCNSWRVHTRWWEPREMVWRDYVKVVTDRKLLCVIYHDLQDGGWFMYRIYD
jgi:hypothetical protein